MMTCKKFVIAMAAAAFGVAASAQATVKTWSGPTSFSGPWNQDASYWGGTFPVTGDEVYIPTGNTLTFTSATPADLVRLEVQGNSTVTMAHLPGSVTTIEVEQNATLNLNAFRNNGVKDQLVVDQFDIHGQVIIDVTNASELSIDTEIRVYSTGTFSLSNSNTLEIVSDFGGIITNDGMFETNASVLYLQSSLSAIEGALSGTYRARNAAEMQWNRSNNVLDCDIVVDANSMLIIGEDVEVDFDAGSFTGDCGDVDLNASGSVFGPC